MGLVLRVAVLSTGGKRDRTTELAILDILQNQDSQTLGADKRPTTSRLRGRLPGAQGDAPCCQ
jgi:hypothetical protein